MIEKSTLQFLKDLKRNNYREWFNENKNRYETAKDNVIANVAELLTEVNKFDPENGLPEPKRCLFRIYRDTRFSKNKDPYKANMGATFDGEGTKSLRAGYYLHVEPGASFVSCGSYMSLSPIVNAIRKAIYEDFERFDAIVSDRTFKKLFTDLTRNEDALKRVPNGFDKESPAAEYLKLKHFYVFHSLTDEQLQSKTFVKDAAKILKATKPLKDWLNEVIEDVEI